MQISSLQLNWQVVYQEDLKVVLLYYTMNYWIPQYFSNIPMYYTTRSLDEDVLYDTKI